MKTIQKLLVLLMLTGLCVAQPVLSDGEPTAHKSKAHRTAKKARHKATPAVSAEDIKQLRDQIQAQQAQIDQLKQQDAQRAQQTEQAVTNAQKSAAAAQEKAAATDAVVADTNTKVDTVKSDVADLKTTVTSTVVSVKKDEKRVGELELPAYVHYKGVKITPGGWVEATAIYRTHNANSDSADSFGAQPFEGSSNSHLSELRFSARHSNINTLFEGKVHGLTTTGYVEFDFQGAAPTANETQTNSFQPRLRELWANVESDSGWSFAGGQTWSLITSNRKGIAPKREFRPSLIDASYLVGFHYAREGTFRVTKTFADKKVAVAFAVENPATVSSAKLSNSTATTLPNTQGLQNGPNTSPNNGFAAGAVPSTNLAPDLVAKVAFDPGWGHFEFGGIARFFRDRVVAVTNTGGKTNVTEGGAVTVNMILPVLPKKVDFVFVSLAGKGIGRFGVTGGPDVTQRPTDGALIPVKGAQALAGFETHPTSKLDFNLYAGTEYYGRTYYQDGKLATQTAGYGSPFQSLSGCALEVSGTTCNSDNRDTWEITPQLWYRFFKGKAGTLQYGLEYSYVHRRVWQGLVSTGARQPNSINNIVMSSFRYYLP